MITIINNGLKKYKQKDQFGTKQEICYDKYSPTSFFMILTKKDATCVFFKGKPYKVGVFRTLSNIYNGMLLLK